ncbi:twin-arginine translocation pathway signal protein [Brevundimonas sp. AAP58]|uniref:Acg family FMN-binding oxidoreductase n=1 Tax=Brevundimonas sp. AAP58 TaxID=1523422 RepID=UPI0006B98E25|nr:twin-arginine translocation pathway signal protein [Brevundimonas sp. AAP58]KPF77839.1 twin-arginine translocation pathway signal protein [Brevundimonas sp. AAP58]
MKRRQFLALAGGGVVLAAGGGAAAWLTTRTPERALAPWKAAAESEYADARLHALSYAILAPNPHNRQPWIADVRTPGEVTLRVDTGRMLPHTDPFNRQITIGLGCFLELMTMAAAERGVGVTLDLFPDGEDPERLTTDRVAVARFGQPGSARPDPLFAHALDRRSNKEPYDTTRPVDPALLARVLAAARTTPAAGSVDEESIRELRALTHEALRIEIETPRTYGESVDLFRIGRAEVERNPDGIDFTGPLFDTLGAVGVMNRRALADPESQMFKQGLAAVFANTDTAMGHLWMVTADNGRTTQITAGRDWVRLNLAATREGLAMQPLSQALQEFAEMKPLYDRVHARLAPQGGVVQMLARVGYGPRTAPSPRWPLNAKVIV